MAKFRCIAVLIASLQAASAAHYLVISRPSPDTWSVVDAEEVEINGSAKVRTLVAGAPAPATFDAKALGRLSSLPLQRFSLIRRSPDGTWAGQSGASTQWQPLVPDGLKGKASGTLLELWKGSSVSVRKSRKEKAGDAIAVEAVYAIIPGENASVAAVSVATSLTPHMAPGVSAADAFAAMAGLMPVVAKEFPAEASKVRDELRSSLLEKLKSWEAGDAERLTLDQALLLKSAVDAGFATDPELTELGKKAAKANAWLQRRTAILRALNEGKQSDAFLLAYREFEPYDKSFPDLISARATHLKESANLHIAMAERLRTAGDYAGAVRHLKLARQRDPQRTDTPKLLEQVRLEVARITSEQFAQNRKSVDPRSPTQVQLQRRLRLIEQDLADNKYAEAEAVIAEAEAIDKDEPRIRFLQAQLEANRGDLGKALAVLDLYAGMAITPKDFEEGENLRAKVLYEIQNLRNARRSELTTLASSEKFATALQQAADGLKADNEEPAFLFEAGVNACILRQCRDAGPLLKRFLDLTDSTTGNRSQRISALRLMTRTKGESKIAVIASAKDGDASWFSGAPLDNGAVYDPVSLSFQPKVSAVKASDHLTVQYMWVGNQLKAVHARYEDKKTGSNVRSVIGGLAVTGHATLQSADKETNDFYFSYYDDVPQVLSVNHDNQLVKSVKRRIQVPAVGLMAATSAFGGIGVMSSMGGMGGMLGGMGGYSGMLGNMGGYGGMGGWGSTMSVASQYTSMAKSMLEARNSFTSTAPTYSIHSDPEGVTSRSGLVTLWNSPRIDTEIAELARGKRVAVGFSGNAWFHPFGWSGIHMFELAYDAQGRVSHAWEMNEPNAPRLDFAWDGNRLQSVTAKDSNGSTTYSRHLTYNGGRLVSENVTFGGKQSKIEYKYDKTGRMIEAKCDNDPSLDNRSRTVEFMAEAAPARRPK